MRNVHSAGDKSHLAQRWTLITNGHSSPGWARASGERIKGTKINSTTTFNLHTRCALQRLQRAYLASCPVCAVCLDDDNDDDCVLCLHSANNNWLQRIRTSIDRFIVRRPACSRLYVCVRTPCTCAWANSLPVRICTWFASAKHRLRAAQMPLRLWTWYWINLLIKPSPHARTHTHKQQQQRSLTANAKTHRKANANECALQTHIMLRLQWLAFSSISIFNIFYVRRIEHSTLNVYYMR